MVGLLPHQIYQEGLGAESLRMCIASFRERPGTLVVGIPLDGAFRVAGITVCGIPTATFDDLIELSDAMQNMPVLHRLFLAL